MSQHAIVTLIGILAVLYLPINIIACRISYRLGITRGKALGHDEASQIWPQHCDCALVERNKVLLKALETTRHMISGEMIEHAIIDTESMCSLGRMLDEVSGRLR